MKHLTIIVPDGQNNLTTIACISGAYEIFAAANDRWAKIGKKKLFKIELAGVSRKVVKENKMLIDWVGKQYRSGAEVASTCTGRVYACSGWFTGREDLFYPLGCRG